MGLAVDKSRHGRREIFVAQSETFERTRAQIGEKYVGSPQQCAQCASPESVFTSSAIERL